MERLISAKYRSLLVIKVLNSPFSPSIWFVLLGTSHLKYDDRSHRTQPKQTKNPLRMIVSLVSYVAVVN